METVCLEQQSNLIGDFGRNSANEIMYLAGILDEIEGNDFICLVTSIKRTKPNIEQTLKRLAQQDNRILYHTTIENPSDFLFLCVLKSSKSLSAILQFRTLASGDANNLYFICKQSPILTGKSFLDEK